MICFRIHLPDSLEEKILLDEIMREVIGFEGIRANADGIWACFKDRECAQLAQWILDLNGAKGE